MYNRVTRMTYVPRDFTHGVDTPRVDDMEDLIKKLPSYP